MVELWIISIVVASTILGAFGSFFLKLASKKLEGMKNIVSNKELFIGLALFVLATLLMIIALKFDKLSKIFPITSLTYVWVALISWRLLKEKITNEKIAAFVLIIIGIIFVTN